MDDPKVLQYFVHTSLLCVCVCVCMYISDQNSLILLAYQPFSPVGFGCRIHCLHLCRGLRHTHTSHPQWASWIWHKKIWQCGSRNAGAFGECRVPLYCHHSLVHSGLEWYYLPTPPLGQDMTQGQFLSGV